MLGIVVHTFNPSTGEAEAEGISLSLRPGWSTKQAQVSQCYYTKKLSEKEVQKGN